HMEPPKLLLTNSLAQVLKRIMHVRARFVKFRVGYLLTVNFLLRDRAVNTHGFDRAILRLDEFDRLIRDFHARAGLWYVLQVFKDEAIDGLRTVERKIEAELSIEVTQQGTAF